MSVVLGYAGYTAVLAGIGAFGPSLVEGLGIFHDQSSASLYFGGAVSLAGAVGTPFGGWLLDWATRRKRREVRRSELAAAARAAAVADGGEFGDAGGGLSDALLAKAEAEAAAAAAAEEDTEGEDNNDPAVVDLKLNVALPQAVWLMCAGTAGTLGGVMVGAENSVAFFGLLTIGALCLCATTTGINQAIMASVRPESRSFAIGLGTLLVHALGDVPAPTVIGVLADELAPETCTHDPSSGQDTCTQSARGLQVTIAIAVGWLVWPIVLWAVAWLVAARRAAARREAAAAAAGGPVRVRDVVNGSFASARGAGLKGGNPEWAVHGEGGLEMRARGERGGGL